MRRPPSLIFSSLIFLCLFAPLLTACGDEPDFDRRYAEAEGRIADKAAVMERDLNASESSDK